MTPPPSTVKDGKRPVRRRLFGMPERSPSLTLFGFLKGELSVYLPYCCITFRCITFL